MPKYDDRLLGAPLISNSINQYKPKLDIQPDFRFPWRLWLIVSAIMAVIGILYGVHAGNQHAETVQACLKNNSDFKACTSFLR